MAIPTQFSVAKARKCPLANPNQPIDGANPLTAEGIGFISGAYTLPAEPNSGVGNAVTIPAESVAPVDNSSVIGAEDSASIATPSALTANAGTLVSPPFPLNHARVLYKNELVNASASSTAANSNPSYALVPNTWQRWSFRDNTAAIEFTLPDNVGMDTICIGAHNLGDTLATYRMFYSVNISGSWIPLVDAQAQNNNAIMFHRDSAFSARRIRIEFSGTIDRKEAGYISAGIALQMQRPFFNGHQPYTDSDVTEYYSNRTESGNIIGRQIRRRGYETTYEWQNIDDGWYRQYIPDFKESAKKNPMFIAWNLLEYPNDVAFGETTGDISTSMQNGTRTKRNGLSFTLKGV